MKYLDEFNEKYSDRGFQVISINTDGSRSLRSFSFKERYNSSIFSPSQNLSSISCEASVDLARVKYFSNIKTHEVIEAIIRIANINCTGSEACNKSSSASKSIICDPPNLFDISHSISK